MRKKNTPFFISLLIMLFGVYGSFATVFAATGNQFTVGLTVAADVTPPSVPLGVAATPISSAQIDVSWNASTDNIAVGGYVVYRNAAPIATTTGLTYSDTGLTASTLYSYTINAFDTSNNYSGLSSAASATTLAAPGGGPPPDTTPPAVSIFSPLNGAVNVSTSSVLQMTMTELVNKGSGNITIKRYLDSSVVETIPVGSTQVTMIGAVITITPSSPFLSNTQYYVEVSSGAFTDQSGNLFAGISGNATWSFSTGNAAPVVISNVVVSPSATSSVVAFNTNVNAQSAISWGTTTAYSDGTAGELGYSLVHSISLSGLSPNTLYYFQITAQDSLNNLATPHTGTFTTSGLPPPPDVTPPANPSAFAAVPSYTSIALSWVNPSDADFQAVRIMRKTSGYPSTPTDGILVYDGAAQAVVDSGLSEGTTYHYTAFARDASLNYSSGAIISRTTLVTPPPPATTTPPTTPPATPPGGTTPTTPPSSGGGSETTSGGGGTTPTTTEIFPPITSTSSGPFIDFPTTGTPSAEFLSLKLSDFIFGQPKNPRITPRGEIISVDGEQNITVSISYDRLPDVLKTISITVVSSNNKESSYLLSVNKEKTAFEGVVPALRNEGQYAFHIDILDHEKQGLIKILGIFESHIAQKISAGPVAQVTQFVTDTLDVIETPVAAVAPVALPVGVAVGASQAVLLATNVTSLYDLYLLFLKLIGLFTGFFRKKRSEPWGVVYDSVTKRPLDPAYVIAKIKETTKSKGEAITDLDGRYGFLLSPGEYIIEANKTHYKFPSDKLKGRNHDEFYDNLYFGDSFRVREGGVVRYNIPLDPIEFDWNEFAKTQDGVFRIYSKNQNIRLWIFNIIFYAGLIFSVLSFAIAHTMINGIIVGIYLSIAVFQIFWKATHTVTRIVSKTTGKPIPFALVRVWLSGVNTVVKKTVADEFGRFYFLVSPGTYFVTIDQKQPDGSYVEVFRSGEMNLKRGVVKEDLLV